MKRQGLLLIISGPSGSGKGTIVEQLKAKENFYLSISATTRSPREYEQEGVHYFFRTKQEFEKMIANRENCWNGQNFVGIFMVHHVHM